MNTNIACIVNMAFLQENKDKKFAEGEVDLRNIFKIKRIAFRRLEKAQKKEDVGETEKYQNLFDTMTKLHSKVFISLYQWIICFWIVLKIGLRPFSYGWCKGLFSAREGSAKFS